MNKAVQNTLAIIAGLVAGMALNGWLVSISGDVIPLPEGVDPNNLDSIKANLHLYSWKNYIMPFTAHALVTVVAAFIAAKIWVGNKMIPGYVFGGFFLLGGIAAAYMIGTPPLPTAVDLILAYLPMGWLGSKLAGAK